MALGNRCCLMLSWVIALDIAHWATMASATQEG